MCKVLALKGNQHALDSRLDRLEPRCKPANSRFRLPAIRTTEDLAKVLPALLQAVARGQLSAQECETIGRTLESQQRVIEASEYEARIRALEQKAIESSGGTPGAVYVNWERASVAPQLVHLSPPDLEQSPNSDESGTTSGNDDEGQRS